MAQTVETSHFKPSNCIGEIQVKLRQASPGRAMLLRMVKGLRMQASIATLGFLPAALKRLRNSASAPRRTFFKAQVSYFQGSFEPSDQRCTGMSIVIGSYARIVLGGGARIGDPSKPAAHVSI